VFVINPRLFFAYALLALIVSQFGPVVDHCDKMTCGMSTSAAHVELLT